MKFKMKQFALLVGGLSAASSAFAASVTVGEIDIAHGNGSLQQAWITGATAPTASIYAGWVAGCDANTNTIFSADTSSTKNKPGDLGNFNAYACKRGGIVSVLYQSGDGGSLNAYTPQTLGTVQARMLFVGTGNGCNPTPLVWQDNSNRLNDATVFKSCKRIEGATGLPTTGSAAAASVKNKEGLEKDPRGPQIPVGGFSDVEAALFSASIGGGNLTGKGEESDVGVGQVFGVAVSIPLYRAMQAHQGITGLTAQTQDLPENAPNITSGQYTALISIGDRDLNSLLGDNTTPITIQRRVDTSGSQSSSNAFFLRNPCNAGVQQQLPIRTTANNAAKFFVNANSGSGGVKDNLTVASDAPNDVSKKYAIGVLSTENNWRTDSSTSNGYRYLKVDGVHPEDGDEEFARKSANRGDYKFYMELKQFVRAKKLHDGREVDLTAFERDLMIGDNSLSVKLSNPPSTSACAVFPRGLSLSPTAGSGCVLVDQVAKMTNGGQNCATAYRIF